jgi:hypothetical protein
MSSEVSDLAALLPPDSTHHHEFGCFCGAWFPDRVHFDVHIRQHPGRFIICDCCNRIMPTGQWTVDSFGNFLSLD